MSSLTEERPLGVCVDVDCPVSRGVGECRLGTDILHCSNFEPELVDDQPETTEETTSTVRAEPATLGPGPESEKPTASSQGDAAALEDASSLGPFRSAVYAVEAPSGPRRKVDLSGNEVSVYSGLPLSGEEANHILGSTKAEIVMLAGLPNVGKTTMLSALYEALCQGPIGDFLFGGSLTLLGFVEKSFYASTASGRISPDTMRTSQDELSRPYLHLRLASPDGQIRKEFLIADVSGEYFRDVVSGGGIADAAPLLRRADQIVHFIDAAEYADRRQRQQAMAMTTARLRRLHESQAYGSRATHTLVVSRADLCDPEPLQELLHRLRNVAQKWASNAQIISIASRPSNSSGPVGLADFLYALALERSKPDRGPYEDRSLNRRVGTLIEALRRAEQTPLMPRMADMLAGSFFVSLGDPLWVVGND